MKVLVTGNRGFIGQNMINALKNEHELSFFEWGEEYPKIQGLDLVVHLGANSSTTERDVEKIMKQNYDFSVWMFHECQEWKVHLQYSSSASVYGSNTKFSESDPVDPRSPYSWSKYLFDRYVSDRLDRLKAPVQGFRYFNVYGPNENHKSDQASPYHKFTQQAINTGIIKLFEGSENYLRDFVHVDTVVDVHKKFFEINQSGIWNVGTGTARSFYDLAKEIADKYEATIQFIPMPENLKTQYQTYTCADLTRLNSVINKIK
jgi:ADP-L-glycero-D-manno-heptose 6-epimerase